MRIESDEWPGEAGRAEDFSVTDVSDARSRRWEATHQRIYDVAIELFQKFGFEKVNIGQIASQSGVSVPTFYAHYPSKEHIVMSLPTAQEMAELLATQPADRPLTERLRNAAPIWFGSWSPEYRETQLIRWRIIATTPSLRNRAAEFERETARLISDAVPSKPGQRATPTEQVVVNAHLAAFTVGMLRWAESNGERKLEEVVDEAFAALQGMGSTGI
jgi:AcrR family transcriptional regulator